MVGTTNIHLVRPLDTRITIEVTNSWKLGGVKNKKIVGVILSFLSSPNRLDVKKESLAGRLARDFL